MTNKLSLSGRFKGISLSEMDAVSLLKRVDSKFVIDTGRLEMFFKNIETTHRVLEIEGSPIQTYKTIYYDTPDYKMYTAHHNRKKHRYKIRTRDYVESELSFLEIKNKSNKGKTTKKRIAFSDKGILCSKMNDFIVAHSPFEAQDLMPVLGNTFNRITLVNNDLTERMTIDVGLKAWEFEHSENDLDLGGVSIIELKRDAYQKSKTLKLLRDLKIKPTGFSKYAVSSSILLSHKVKSNNFKAKQRYIQKIGEMQ